MYLLKIIACVTTLIFCVTILAQQPTPAPTPKPDKKAHKKHKGAEAP